MTYRQRETDKEKRKGKTRHGESLTMKERAEKRVERVERDFP